MKKIGIINCLNAGQVCAGIGCLRAFRSREGKFTTYGDEELELTASFSCNGCEGVEDQESYDNGRFTPLDKDKGMLGKLHALTKNNVDVVHMGICCWNRDGVWCPNMKALALELERRGITVVKGTH